MYSVITNYHTVFKTMYQ